MEDNQNEGLFEFAFDMHLFVPVRLVGNFGESSPPTKDYAYCISVGSIPSFHSSKQSVSWQGMRNVH